MKNSPKMMAELVERFPWLGDEVAEAALDAIDIINAVRRFYDDLCGEWAYCICDEQSWYGEGHVSDCPVQIMLNERAELKRKRLKSANQ